VTKLSTTSGWLNMNCIHRGVERCICETYNVFYNTSLWSGRIAPYNSPEWRNPKNLLSRIRSTSVAAAATGVARDFRGCGKVTFQQTFRLSLSVERPTPLPSPSYPIDGICFERNSPELDLHNSVLNLTNERVREKII